MFEILILVSLIGIYKIWKEIDMGRRCPDDATLKQAAFGPKNTRNSAIMRHASTCDECLYRIDRMNGRSY